MFFPPVEAVVFKKGDKVINMHSGKIYEFQHGADIGIYGADSGLGELYVVNGKVYAITPEGVKGMQAVSAAVDLQAELDEALKFYHSKRAEAARAWKYLAAEKATVKKLQKELDALKEKVVELEQILGLADKALVESKDVLTAVKGTMKLDKETIKKQEKNRNLLVVYIVILLVTTVLMLIGGAIYSRRTSQKIIAEIPEPDIDGAQLAHDEMEEIEIVDLTDLT
jgi:hypothetical protein